MLCLMFSTCTFSMASTFSLPVSSTLERTYRRISVDPQHATTLAMDSLFATRYALLGACCDRRQTRVSWQLDELHVPFDDTAHA